MTDSDFVEFMLKHDDLHSKFLGVRRLRVRKEHDKSSDRIKAKEFVNKSTKAYSKGFRGGNFQSLEKFNRMRRLGLDELRLHELEAYIAEK